MRPGGAVPSFLKPDWKTYDWSVDAGQRWTLLAAKERGATVFEAFSNSPPCFMTKSGYASGNWDANDDNLPSKNYEVREEGEGFFFCPLGGEFFFRFLKEGGRIEKKTQLFSLRIFQKKKKKGLCLLPGRGGLLLQERAQRHFQVRVGKVFPFFQTFSFPWSKRATTGTPSPFSTFSVKKKSFTESKTTIGPWTPSTSR